MSELQLFYFDFNMLNVSLRISGYKAVNLFFLSENEHNIIKINLPPLFSVSG